MSEASIPTPPGPAPPGPTPSGPGPPRSGIARWILVGLGWIFVALGTVGAFLPILPTTPFLLLASACFARSSPGFQRRLQCSRVFGPYLRQWQSDRSVSPAAKRKAYGLVVITFALSIAWVDSAGLRWMLVGLGSAVLAFLAWLPVRSCEADPPGS